LLSRYYELVRLRDHPNGSLDVCVVEAREVGVKPIVQVSEEKAEVRNSVTLKAWDKGLELLHFHLRNQLLGHLIALRLLALAVPQMACDEVKQPVFQLERVCDASFVPDDVHPSLFQTYLFYLRYVGG